MGRPSLTVTAEMRSTARQLKRAGWSDERIAVHLGIARGTLRLHFSHELSAAADDMEAALLEFAWKAARRGRASAIIWIARRIAQARAGGGE